MVYVITLSSIKRMKSGHTNTIYIGILYNYLKNKLYIYNFLYLYIQYIYMMQYPQSP